MVQTRAAILTGPHDVRLVERELQVGPDDVLVETRLAGICGTDKNFYQGRFPRMRGAGYSKSEEFVTLPLYIGHEGGGVVQDVGRRVKRFKRGDFVMSFNVNNTMADFFCASEDDLEPLAAGLPEEIACLGEPIACAMFSGLHSNVNLGDTAVVYGVGFAGQIIAQVMKRKGARLVVAVDIVEEKLELARRLGADVVINSRNVDPVEAILDLTEGKGADVVAEAAGVAETINQSVQSVRHNGTLVFYSWVTQDVTINISRFHHDSLHVVNTGLVHHTTEERKVWAHWALRPVVQGTIKVEELVNRRFRLDAVAEAFRADAEDAGAIKTVLMP